MPKKKFPEDRRLLIRFAPRRKTGFFMKKKLGIGNSKSQGSVPKELCRDPGKDSAMAPTLGMLKGELTVPAFGALRYKTLFQTPERI